MKQVSRRFQLLGILVAMAMGSALAWQAYGAYRAAGQPTVIVTINLAKVMENLNQRADNAARLNTLRDTLNAEQERRAAELKKMTDAAEALKTQIDGAKDDATKKSLEQQMMDLQEQSAMATLDFQAWFAFSSEKADIEAALAMQDLYRSVKTAASQMAAANGYDIVLVDDSQGELATSPEARVSRVDQVRQQIASRRMLHVNPTIDITDDLTQRMNNAHKAAAPKPAP